MHSPPRAKRPQDPGLGRWAQVGLGMVGVKLVQVPVKRAAQLRVWGLVQG